MYINMHQKEHKNIKKGYIWKVRLQVISFLFIFSAFSKITVQDKKMLFLIKMKIITINK